MMSASWDGVRKRSGRAAPRVELKADDGLGGGGANGRRQAGAPQLDHGARRADLVLHVCVRPALRAGEGSVVTRVMLALITREVSPGNPAPGVGLAAGVAGAGSW
jgi:hypothetical protein